jgi:hypothetical protein
MPSGNCFRAEDRGRGTASFCDEDFFTDRVPKLPLETAIPRQ